MQGFALMLNDNGKEAMAIHFHAMMHKIPVKRFQCPSFVPAGFVPSGSVKWCEHILGRHPVPDYYPEFLKEHLHRNVWKADFHPMCKKVFIKPADEYKRFKGYKTRGGITCKYYGPFWCSDIVKFVNEWRYYIADGKVLTGEWYQGNNDDLPAPNLDAQLPSDYCGALDFGVLSSGEFALVEAHHPYACGWYGGSSKHDLYAEWLVKGWEYMTR